MFIIGLTGGIASGKSLVSSYLASLGAGVIDADLVAREVVEPGRPALAEVVREFGPGVLSSDGTLNRKELGRLVFSDQARLDRLNRITHPYILEIIRERLEAYRAASPCGAVVIDAPLLIETGLHRLVDEVWVVYVDPTTQLQRLMKRDRLTPEAAAQRIASQLPLEEKVRYAHRIIYNRGEPEETLRQVRMIWLNLRGQGRINGC